ncbi:acyl carrier protein, partial [Pseudonocardia alni]|uniref:acyl carrier protein n=1 Tax=Pseudonocardia alni TaxID=33907 RepID=UPI001AD7623C
TAPVPTPAAAAAPPAPVSSPAATGAPDPLVERTVARVFSDLLGGPVEVGTPFFQLGASSLTLVLAHRRLVELDPQLTVVDLFAHPTVRDLARHLTATATEPTGAGAPPPVPDPPAPQPGDGRAAGRRAARARAAAVAG